VPRLAAFLFHLAVVRPLVFGLLGMRIRHRDRLPASGPAILVANHNSHLDAFALACLFPVRLLPCVRPLAARDYFLADRARAWIARDLVGVVPIDRHPRPGAGDPLAGCSAALARGDILILFPEGTRGEPERLGTFRPGIAHLARRHPEAPVIPVGLRGFGIVLPKGGFVPVPVACEAVIGEPVAWHGDRSRFLDSVRKRISGLARNRRDIGPWGAAT